MDMDMDMEAMVLESKQQQEASGGCWHQMLRELLLCFVSARNVAPLAWATTTSTTMSNDERIQSYRELVADGRRGSKRARKLNRVRRGPDLCVRVRVRVSMRMMNDDDEHDDVSIGAKADRPTGGAPHTTRRLICCCVSAAR